MTEDLVGVRFAPTGEELILHYLKNKILGNAWLVDKAINEINFLNYEPDVLPSLAKIDSKDLVWYFFSRIEYANMKKTKIKRTIATGKGVWKCTGEDRTIKGKRISKGKIGIKKSFRYCKKGTEDEGTPWVMHEYHIPCLSELSPQLPTYVICKVKYNIDKAGDIAFGGNNQSGQSQSSVSSALIWPEQRNKQEEDVSVWWDIVANILNCDNNNRSVQPEVPYHLTPDDTEFIARLRNVDRGLVEDFIKRNFNVHMPKKPLSGIIDYSSDSDDDDDDDDDDAKSTSECWVLNWSLSWLDE